MNLIHFILSYLLLLKSLEINSFLIRKDSTESLWASDKGNSQNTYRIEPSLAGNYSHLNWKFEYNLTSQDNTPFGLAAGLNGDLYFFISQSRSHAGDFILCLTPTGEVRWKVLLESVTGMYPIGLSNIVVDRQGTLYYIVGWSGDQVFTAKACQVSQANTMRPVQKCIQNYNLISASGAPLAFNEKYDQLITAVDDNKFESVPAVVNKTDLSLFWINRHVFGARSNQNYRCDFQSGDIFWFGGDDRFVKFDYSGQRLIENFTVNSLVGRDFVLNHEQQIIVVPWQDATHLPWKLLVSSFDVSNQNIKLRWTWHALPPIANNDDVTPPTMDSNGTVFMSSMPLAFAIDHIGKVKWTSELATSSEMKQYNLIAYCIAMNSNRRMLYILSGSSRIQKSNSLFFISVVNVDSGKIIKRIELDVAKNQLVLPQCPILIGNEIFYFAWLTGEYPNLVPFHVTAFAQL